MPAWASASTNIARSWATRTSCRPRSWPRSCSIAGSCRPRSASGTSSWRRRARPSEASVAEFAVLVHFLADPHHGLHDQRRSGALARPRVTGDHELGHIVVEGHDVQGGGAIALCDLQAARAGIVHQDADRWVLACRLQRRGEHLVRRGIEDDRGEIVAWPAVLLTFGHLLDPAQRLAGDEHPLRLGRARRPGRPPTA